MATAEQIEPVAVEVKNDTISSVKSFLSGGFGGMASVLVGYVCSSMIRARDTEV